MKKIILILFLFIVFIANASADITRSAISQGEKFYINKFGQRVNPKQTKIQKPDQEVEIIYKNRLYGFKDKDGNWILEPQFEELGYISFINGYISVAKQKKWGAVDTKGNLAVKPEFENILYFHDNIARAMKDGKCGFIDNTGKWIITPKFQDIQEFSEGLAAAKYNSKWGYIDKRGDWVIQPKFNSIICRPEKKYEKLPICDGTSNFHEGLAGIQYDLKNEAYIDKTGKIIIKGDFKNIQRFSEGVAAVSKNGKYGYINTFGKFVIKPQFIEAKPFHNGIAEVVKN